MDTGDIGKIVLGFIFGVAGAGFGAFITALLTEHRRLSFRPLGPTTALVDRSWLFYYEFEPRVGMPTTGTAVLNAGGGVDVKDMRGKSMHQAETFWAGVPVASTANLYGKKGLFVFQVYPKSHMVLFYSAGTAPYANHFQLGQHVAGVVGFDWEVAKRWKVEITVSAPEAAARTVTTTVGDVCQDARGTNRFPGVAAIIGKRSELVDGTPMKGSQDAIYILKGGVKRLIPSPLHFVTWNFRDNLIRVSDVVIDEIPAGPNWVEE